MSQSLPTIDGRYVIQAELGRGAMGRVVGVIDTLASPVPLACKILERPELRADFVAEFDLLRRLAHPGFVTAHRLGVDAATGEPYAVLERCDGAQLADLGTLSSERVIAITADILRALDHLHRLDLVHGDVAPVNVVLHDGTGSTIKLLDLGAGGRRGTRRGTTSGVLGFAAPERLAGAPLAPTADLWSLGCLAFHLLHGRHPWPGYPARSTGEEPIDGAGLVASPLAPVLERLLAHQVEDRFPSAGAALAALEAATGETLPLVVGSQRAEVLHDAPYLDVGAQLEHLSQRLRSAADAQKPVVVDIGGAAGSGRTRLLDELSNRLAANGIAAIHDRARPSDGPTEGLERVLRTIDAELTVEGGVAGLVQALGKAVRASHRAVAVLVDDLDLAPDGARESFELLARSVRALPERFGPLLLATVGGGAADVTLEPWDADAVERAITLVFPSRRVGGRVSDPIHEASRGNAGLALDILGELLRREIATVDATSVQIRDADAVRAAAPTSREEAASRAVDALPDALRPTAGVLARAAVPVPRTLFDADALGELLARGVAIAVSDPRGPRVVLASEPLVAACEALVPATEAHAELARRWSALDTGEALAQSLWHHLAGDDASAEAEAEAEAALTELSPTEAAPLVLALQGRGWPRTAAAARRGADILAATGRVEPALALLRLGVDLADDGAGAALALGRIGALQAHQSRHPQALEALREALERGGDALAPGERAKILATLARSGVLSGAVDDAAAWASEGLELAGDDAGLAAHLGYARGLVGYFRGDLQGAHEAFDAALSAARRVGDRVEEAAIVTGLGLVAHRRGDLDEALRHYRSALKLGEQAGDEARVLSSLQNLGVVFHERGEWIAALDTYREALGLAEALGQTGRIVQISGNLGNLWRYLGELGRAREVLQVGLEKARAEDNRYMEGLLLNLLGDVASDGEAWDLAERLWLDAIRVTEAAQCAAEEAEARLNLGRLQLERQLYAEARRTLERALAVAERVEHATFTSQSLALLSAVERTSVHGDMGRAQALSSRALELLPQVDNPGARWPILLEAAWLARDVGELDAAADRVREVRQLLQSQLDAVPARHRAAFRARRDRRRAWSETATFVAATRSGERAQARDIGWNRLLEINKRLATEHRPKRLLEYIMDSAIQLTDAERGFLLLGEEGADDDELAVHVARNLDQENIRNKQLKISHGIARRVVESGEPAITIDAMEDERYRDQLSVHDLRLRSILCLPMIGRGRVLGAIYLDNRFRSSAFGAADLPFMEAFADLAAIALDNARLIEAHEKSQEALEKARAEVEALNKRLAGELEARTQELADTHKVVIRQQRELVARHQYDNIIGEAPSVRRLFAMMDRLLDNDVPVLIEGESGTGKELVARAIHFNGARQSRPFVAVNCGAIPPTLLESELFGHVRGAFTNATSDKKGLFEAAHTGTLLLDEIGELPLEMQVKLLRVLQSGEVKKVGSTREIKVDVRILAATNRKLEEEVREQRFREDLYYRLSVVPIQIPPLRARKEDIPLLVQHFLEQNRATGLGNVTGISKPALTLLERYSWPGNIRQLEMVLKNASVFAEAQTLEPRDFESFPDILGQESSHLASAAVLVGKTLAEIEREAIIAALRENQGNKKRSAEQLGIDRRTLYNKLAAYNIVVERELRVR